MLTADLVPVRRRGDRLTVVPLDDDERVRARALGGAYVDLARAHVGLTRGALLEASRQVPVSARDKRLADGLLKLVLDGCEFEEACAVDAAELRRTLFTRAAAARRAGAPDVAFDREAIVRDVAAAFALTPEAMETSLYADLPDAHRLMSCAVAGGETLLATYETGRYQAVLLRAVKLRAEIRSRSPGTYRALFRRLKFLRLLYRIERLEKTRRAPAGYVLDIDGPFSLFESVTKYGLQLALALPALSACDEWAIEADLRWGNDRRPVRFALVGSGDGQVHGAILPTEVQNLLSELERTSSPWRATVSDAILDLPGVGACIPDLELTDPTRGLTVYLEVLGFWSREAVWRRIELAQKGLPHPIVFAVSKQLRVSEAALGDDTPAALYVYSKVMNARQVLARVEAAASRVGG